jgi:adenine-specific DNA-methyltransferase
MQDIWEFKDYQYPIYPTEKNIEMIKNIICASSNEDSIVLDFFCGSGTTLAAAQELNRKWIGIDKSEMAIRVARDRINNLPNTSFSENAYSYLKTAFDKKDKQHLAAVHSGRRLGVEV